LLTTTIYVVAHDKSLGLRGLLPLWSQVRALWLLIWWSLEVYMVVNFRACEISQGARKLVRTPTLKKKIIKNWLTSFELTKNPVDRCSVTYHWIYIWLCTWSDWIYACSLDWFNFSGPLRKKGFVQWQWSFITELLGVGT
jgi:hypothetical protein